MLVERNENEKMNDENFKYSTVKNVETFAFSVP